MMHLKESCPLNPETTLMLLKTVKVSTARRFSWRRAQGTVELAIMLPLILGLLFAGIEFAFYFSTIHWDNYAAYCGARAVQVGQSAQESTDLLLNGNVTRGARASSGDDRAMVHQDWDEGYHMPVLNQILGDMSFDVTVVLGSKEADYEGQVNSTFADNNM